MKNKGRLILLISLILVLAVITTVIFLTVPDKRLEKGPFWLGFAFAVPVNLCFALVLHFWSGRKKNVDIVHLPVAYYLIGVFGTIYLVVGFLFMYLPFKEMTLPVIAELVITVAYIIAALYFTFGSDYIADNLKEIEGKQLYIRMLKADVDDCALRATQSAVKAALEELSQKIRYSDPMSHAALAGVEAQLSMLVAEIGRKLDSAESEEILSLVQKAEFELDSRNRRCMMLK